MAPGGRSRSSTLVVHPDTRRSHRVTATGRPNDPLMSTVASWVKGNVEQLIWSTRHGDPPLVADACASILASAQLAELVRRQAESVLCRTVPRQPERKVCRSRRLHRLTWDGWREGLHRQPGRPDVQRLSASSPTQDVRRCPARKPRGFQTWRRWRHRVMPRLIAARDVASSADDADTASSMTARGPHVSSTTGRRDAPGSADGLAQGLTTEQGGAHLRHR
jgi:hypothetical protein